MELHRPPFNIDADLIEYLDRQFKTVENEIDSANGITILKSFPNRPRIGKLYSINGELYYYNNDEWFKVLSEPVIPEEFIHV